MITIVALVCHALVGAEPEFCVEKVIGQEDAMSTVMISCEMSQPALAAWKASSLYAGDEWRIARIECRSGDYHPKDSI